MTNKEQALLYTTSLFRELNQLILEWNPYGLAIAGELGYENEFSDDVWALLIRLVGVDTEEDVTRAVADVFSQAFNEEGFSEEACRPVAGSIFRWWRSRA